VRANVTLALGDRGALCNKRSLLGPPEVKTSRPASNGS
jgi:hypothetical protein